jgi:hypothetical protein
MPVDSTLNELLMMLEIVTFEEDLAVNPELGTVLLAKLRTLEWTDTKKHNTLDLLADLDCPNLISVFNQV